MNSIKPCDMQIKLEMYESSHHASFQGNFYKQVVLISSLLTTIEYHVQAVQFSRPTDSNFMNAMLVRGLSVKN